MIAVDTNILVYAHREESPFHEQAYGCMQTLAEGRQRWGIPVSCLYEFPAVVTHPKVTTHAWHMPLVTKLTGSGAPRGRSGPRSIYLGGAGSHFTNSVDVSFQSWPLLCRLLYAILTLPLTTGAYQITNSERPL